MKRFGPKIRRRREKPDPKWQRFFADDPREEAIHEQQRKLDILEMSLADTGLPVKTVNALEKNNILLVADLAQQDRDTLLGMDNFGERTLADCEAILDKLGVPHPSWNRPKAKVRPKHRAPRKVVAPEDPEVASKKFIAKYFRI